MEINWKLRLKNKATLTALVGALVVFVNSVANAFGFDITDVVGNIEGIVGTIISLLVLMGVVVDPTSKGVSDSGIAQTYDKPRNSKNEDEQVDWESNKYIPNKLEPKEYDTSESFTDDRDEVVMDYSSGGGSYEELSEEERDNSDSKALSEVSNNENTNSNQ